MRSHCNAPASDGGRCGLGGRLGRCPPQTRRGTTDAAHGEVAHDAVRDAEDARHLVEHVGLGVEVDQVVDAVRLLVDLVREAPAAPGLVPDPARVASFEQLAHPAQDLVLPLLRRVEVEHEQQLVVVHRLPFLLPLVCVGPARADAARGRRRLGGAGRSASVASARAPSGSADLGLAGTLAAARVIHGVVPGGLRSRPPTRPIRVRNRCVAGSTKRAQWSPSRTSSTRPRCRSTRRSRRPSIRRVYVRASMPRAARRPRRCAAAGRRLDAMDAALAERVSRFFFSLMTTRSRTYRQLVAAVDGVASGYRHRALRVLVELGPAGHCELEDSSGQRAGGHDPAALEEQRELTAP